MKTLDADHIYYIHAAVLEVSKGEEGLCPGKQIESIVKRIDDSLYYQGILSLFDIAAIVVLAVVQGHIFKDGNPGTALIALYDFLYINGYQLASSENEAAEVMLQIEQQPLHFKELSTWIEKNAVTS